MPRKRVFLALGHGACVACRRDHASGPGLSPREDEGLAQVPLLSGFRSDQVVVDIGKGRYWLLPPQRPLPRP